MNIDSPITIGYAWSQEVQLTFTNGGVDAGRSEILSSDTSDPCKVTTKLPHGLSSGKIVIDGHFPNVNINGNQTIVVVDSLNFTVTGVPGVLPSMSAGTIQQVIDATGFSSFAVAARTYTGGSPLSNPAITLSWVDRTVFDFLLSMTAAESAKVVYQNSPLVITISWIDGGLNDAVDILIPIQNV